jgi:large subunit ribosomal protein L25
MKPLPLTAYPRTLSRRNAVRKLRSAGRIPAVIYGGQTQPQNLEVDRKALQDMLSHSASEALLVDLSVDKDSRPKRLALVQEIQHHPISGAMLHLDLHEISETEKVTVSLPVVPTGEAVGVKTGGGVMEHVLHKVKVRCLPKDLPEAIVIDVSALEIGKSIHIGEIPAPVGVEILGDKKAPVLSVSAPVTEEQEAAAAAAAGTPGEVEMIKEKKEEGEAGAAPAAKAGEKAPAAKEAKPAAEKKK